MPELDIATIHEQITADRAAYEEEVNIGGDSIDKFRKYYKGDQPNTLTKNQKVILEGVSVNNSSDNVMAQIVDEGAARLTLLMPSVEGADEGKVQAEEVKQWIEKEIWTKNHLPKVAKTAHRAAIRDRDYCLLPFWKPPTRTGQTGRILIYEEPWWDGSTGVFIQYDDRKQPLYAVKEWSQVFDNNKMVRRDVWTDNALYRYISPGGGTGSWERYNRSDDPIIEGVRQWPVPWVKPDGSPLHIPYAHFQEDKSALAGGPLGQQDKLNDMGYAVVAGMRNTAYQMYWATGAEKPAVEEVGPGVFKYFAQPDTNTGTYPAGDISQMLAGRDSHLQRIASAANLPTHTFSGQWPSGEALLRAELSAVNMALSRVEQFKPAWATLFHRATEIANAFGKVGLDEEALIIAQYDSVDKLDELKRFMAIRELYTAAQTAVGAGMPLLTFMRKYSDWTPAELAQLEKDLQQQEQQAEDAEEATIDRLLRQAEGEAKIERANAQ